MTEPANIEGIVKQVIESRCLIADGDLVLVAVSGGPDSIALLLALHRLGWSVHAAHVDHGLRPESAGDAAFVEEFCRARDIPVTLGAVDITAARASMGGSIQEVARTLRYQFLERTADTVQATTIATGHNRDDRIESVLLNIIRGTGTRGLRGIPYRRDRIIRPLLDISRTQIEEFLAENNIVPRRDASNETVKYARNRVRNELLPYLESQFNPNVRDALLRLSVIASDESEYLDSLADTWLDRHSGIDAAELSELPAALQRRIIRLWLDSAGVMQDAELAHIEDIRHRLGSAFVHTLPGGVRIVSDGTLLRRESDQVKLLTQQSGAPAPISVPGECEYCGWTIAATGQLPAGVQPAIRTFVAGDRMRFSYGHKKLSDVFRESKQPYALRWQIPLLIDLHSGEVLAIANGKISDSVPGIQLTATLREKPPGW